MSGAFLTALRFHAAAHPALGAEDADKLCYQAAFGPAHLVSDGAAARRAFREEFARAQEEDAPAFEPVSDGYVRCGLAAWKRLGLPGDWLLNMCLHTAAQGAAPDAAARFYRCRGEVDALAAAGALPFSTGAWRAYCAAHPAPQPVRHSGAYRLRERPAYRLVDARYAPLLPVFVRLAAQPGRPGARTLAIDGRAAAGKSTAAALLAAALGAGVVHMDDFFLPAALRTPQRLSEPGGNVHYERFAAEVLPQLASGAAFSYRRFDCAAMGYGAPRDVSAGAWRIVEGAYSHHPRFGAYRDLSAFFTVPPDAQRRRVTARDGAAAWEAFETRWIPMEERYFEAFSIEARADVRVRMDGRSDAVRPPREGGCDEPV